MTKRDIVHTIADAMNLQHTRVQSIVQQVLDAIIETLVTEGVIELRGFGVFKIKKRKRRLARNPRTGEKVSVPEKSVVIFKPGRELAEQVRQKGKLPARK
jgi:integration host factor subunit beta